jgi:hypothetical protein
MLPFQLRISGFRVRNQHAKPNETMATELGVPIIAVDYSSVDSLKDALEENEVDTLISALRTMPEEGTPPEVNIVRVAQASKHTRRFVPSNWAIPLTGK